MESIANTFSLGEYNDVVLGTEGIADAYMSVEDALAKAGATNPCLGGSNPNTTPGTVGAPRIDLSGEVLLEL